MAILTLIVGKDHPAGKWSERHNLPATALAAQQGHQVHQDAGEKKTELEKNYGSKDVEVSARAVDEHDTDINVTAVDVAVNESLTLKTAVDILISPLTWLPALCYFTTFGLELLVDGKMADVLFALFSNKIPGFNQETAGYYTSILSVCSVLGAPLILIRVRYLADSSTWLPVRSEAMLAMSSTEDGVPRARSIG